MSLYEYTLHVVREPARGELLADAIAGGIVRIDSGPAEAGYFEGSCLRGRVETLVSGGRNEVDPSIPLDILTLSIDGRSFERALLEEPEDFVSWLWHLAESLAPACFFMTGGGDTRYYEKGQEIHSVTFSQLPRLVAHGEVAVIHPIMYFAERLGHGALCEKARRAPWEIVESRAGLGCLLLRAAREPATGALDIMEPGSAYVRLRAFFDTVD
jgi:hypothetical protein